MYHFDLMFISTPRITVYFNILIENPQRFQKLIFSAVSYKLFHEGFSSIVEINTVTQ